MEVTYPHKLNGRSSPSSRPSPSVELSADTTRSSTGATAAPTSPSTHHAQADIGRTLCRGIVYVANATNPAELEYAAEQHRSPLADTVAASDTAGASDRPRAQLEPSARDTCVVKTTADESEPVDVGSVRRRDEQQRLETWRDHPAVGDEELPRVVHVDIDSVSSLQSTSSASDDLAQLPFAPDDDKSINCIGELCAETVWSTETYEQRLELRKLRGRAFDYALEAPPTNAASRRVPLVGDVYPSDTLGDVLVLVLPYLTLPELAVLARVDYTRLVFVVEEMRRRPLRLHLSDHDRLVQLLCSRTRAQKSSRVGSSLGLVLFPLVTLVVDLRDKRDLPNWSLDRIRGRSEPDDGEKDDEGPVQILVSGRVDVVVNVDSAATPRLGFKHMRFILDTFSPAVTRFKLARSVKYPYSTATLGMEVDISIVSHMACVGFIPILDLQPGQEERVSSPRPTLFLVFQAWSDDVRILDDTSIWLHDHGFGHVAMESDEYGPTELPPWAPSTFLHLNIWTSRRAADVLLVATDKTRAQGLVTIQTSANWATAHKDGLADQMTAKFDREHDVSIRVTRSYQTHPDSQAHDVANSDALATVRLLADGLPLSDLDYEDDACEELYSTTSFRQDRNRADLGKAKELLERARLVIVERDRQKTWRAARPSARAADLKSIKPAIRGRMPYLVVKGLFEWLSLHELAICSRVSFAWLAIAVREMSLEHVSFEAGDEHHLNQLFCSRTKAESTGRVPELLRLRAFAVVTITVDAEVNHDHLRHVFRDCLQDKRDYGHDDYNQIRTGRLEVEVRYTDIYAAAEGRVRPSGNLNRVLDVFDPELIHLRGARTSDGRPVDIEEWPALLDVGVHNWLFEHAALHTVVITGFIFDDLPYDTHSVCPWMSPRPAPKLVLVFEGAELIPDRTFARKIIATLKESSHLHRLVAKEAPTPNPYGANSIRFSLIEFWVDHEAVERVKKAASKTRFRDLGARSRITFTSSTQILKDSPDDPLCRALGFKVAPQHAESHLVELDTAQTSADSSITDNGTSAAGKETADDGDGSHQQHVRSRNDTAGGGPSQPAIANNEVVDA